MQKDDVIYRQEAIKTLEKGLPSEPLKSKYTEGITVGLGLAITWVKQLPSAQPDIHCGECKHWHINCLAVADKHGCDKVGDYTKPNFYCGWAERKEGEKD